MAKVTIIVTGDEEINRALKKLSGPEGKKAIRQASRHALRPVLQSAKENAPVATGNLKRNIKLRTMKRSRSRIGSRVTSGGATSKGTETDYTGKAFYGAFQEYGWTPGSRKSAKRGTKKEGQHFMKKAADSEQENAMKRYREHLSKSIDELTK